MTSFNFSPNPDVRTLVKRFERLVNGKPGHKRNAAYISNWENTEFYMHIDKEEKRPRGRQVLTLADTPCLKRSRSLLQGPVSYIEEFAIEQGVSKEEALRMVFDECNRTWHSSISVSSKLLPVDDAVALIYNVNLSLQQYQMIRTLCLPHGIVFPTRNTIDDAKIQFHTPITSFQLKSSVDPRALIDQTVAALFELCKITPDVNGKYNLIGKFGVDGSGSHKIRQQLIDTSLVSQETSHLDPTKSNSFVLSCNCPLKLSCGDVVLWSNPVPNSTSFARPMSLTRCQEDRTVLAVELEPYFPIIRDLHTSKLDLKHGVVTIDCKTQCSMVDGKMVSLLQGDSGAFCHMCHTSRADANDVTTISNGFNITKDYDSCKVAWDKLSSGEISYNSKERQGQCHEGILKSDLFCFSVLHFKLRTLDFSKSFCIIW